MIRTHKWQVTSSGSDGSATGNADSGEPINGRLLAVHLDYTDQPDATTNVVLKTKHSPTQTVLTVSDNATDAWFYPRVQIDDEAGAAITSQYDAAPIDDYLNAAITDGDDAGTVDVTVLVEKD